MIDGIFGLGIFLDAFHQLLDVFLARRHRRHAHHGAVAGEDRREGFTDDHFDTEAVERLRRVLAR